MNKAKPQKTERELLALLGRRAGVALKDLAIVPGRRGYWNVRPLRTGSHSAPDDQARFAEIVEQLRSEFDLKTE